VSGATKTGSGAATGGAAASPTAGPVRTRVAPARTLTRAPAPLLQRRCACGGVAGIDGECAECKKKREGELMQRRARGANKRLAVPPVVHDVLREPGTPLDPATRSDMERRFGHDFGQVRVHTGGRAAESAQRVDAHAYTVGQHMVFDAGQYRPQTPDGQRLLAHELAHTVQQQGLQRAPASLSAVETPEYQRLEGEADRAATAALEAPPTAQRPSAAPATHSGVAPITRAPALVLSRQDRPYRERRVTPAGGGPPEVASYNIAIPHVGDRDFTVTHASTSPDARGGAGAGGRLGGPAIIAYRVGTLYIPPQKGAAAFALWQAKVGANALEMSYNFDSGWTSVRNLPAALRQSRGLTEADLRPNWLLKHGWGETCAADLWRRAGGNVNDFARLGSEACQVDHMVELQSGGTNVPTNLQLLDRQPNLDAGEAIRAQGAELAVRLWESYAERDRPDIIILHFDSVQMAGTAPACDESVCAAFAEPSSARALTCAQIECCAQRVRDDPTACAVAAPSENTEPFPLGAGGVRADTLADPITGNASSTDLEGSPRPANDAAAELVPGMILTSLDREKRRRDEIRAVVCAKMDPRVTKETVGTERGPRTRQPTRVPRGARTAGDRGITFDIEPGDVNQLRLRNKSQQLRFVYPYLSEVTLNSFELVEGQGIRATGTVRPSLPLLNRLTLNVVVDRDHFAVTAPIPAERLRLPIPGFRMTRGELGLELGPTFRPYGELAFEIGPAGRPVFDGTLTVEADENGFVARGVLVAHLPRVDNARGEIVYRNQQWSGGITIESSQIGVPGVRSGVLQVTFSNEGPIVSGTLDLLIANRYPAQLSVRRQNQRWIYAGRATFDLPRLRPIEMEVEYDGEQFSGNARTGFELRGLQGTLNVRYRDGRFSGTGEIEINRGRARGTINVTLSPAQRLSGRGQLDYQFSPNLIGRLGVEMPEEGPVRVTGGIEVPQPLQLFRAFGDNRRIFERSVDIPILGVSIGPVSVGLIARITAGLNVEYGIGPGSLQQIRILTAFNPLEPNPDLEVEAGARLVIPAHAGIALSIRGAIGLSAGVASVTGGLTVTGEAGIRGGLEAGVQIRYARGMFSLDAEASLRASPVLRVLLDADVTAEAGAFGFEIRRQRVWRLTGFELPLGGEVGLTMPVHYDSEAGLRTPSLQDIRWITPSLDPSAMGSRAISQSGSSERERG
jgi:hypothetical protein